MKFKPGDKVICIKESVFGTPHFFGELGKTYTVTTDDVDDGLECITLKETNCRVYADRFALAYLVEFKNKLENL